LHDDIVLTKVCEYMLIKLLDEYVFKNDNYNEMYKNCIEEKINEYKGVNNGDTIDKPWLLS
jgi:hypothetical protein